VGAESTSTLNAVALTDRAFGFGVRMLGTAQAVADTAGGAARGLASIPQLVEVLERLADGTAALTRLADALPRVEELVDEVRTSEELRAIPQAMDSLLQATRLLQPLAEAVHELNRAVATLNGTVSPLQGTAERLGRLVDRFPAGRRRESAPITPPFVAPAEPPTD
jgi:ABC-type transporter Mla subunit MlaD